jgi:hypothetical protein
MNRRTTLTIGTAAGGLLATAFLQAAVAVAEGSGDSAPSDNAFTLGDYTLDPGKDGFDEIGPLSQLSPLLAIGGGNINSSLTDVGLAHQDLEVYGSDDTVLGTIAANVNTQDLLGIGTTQLRVTDVDPADGGSAADLPAVGTVYSVTDLGGGIKNVYEAVPGADGGAASISDTLVTPFGNIDLDSLFGDYDATTGLDPGVAFADFGADGGAGDASDNAFTLGDTTFDPGSDGFAEANELFGVAPLLDLGGGTAALSGFSLPLYKTDLDVYDSDGADVGSVHTSLNTSDILGIHSTQFTITGSDPAEGVDADQLPADGTVYSVTNLGGGISNVYEAVPGSDDSSATVTDTLVTPWGNTDLSSVFGDFDATQGLDPGAALTGLSAADGGAADLGDDAFTLDGLTFDPGNDGFSEVTPLFGVAPLLTVGGGELAGVALAPQDLDVYGSDGDELGSIGTAVNAANLLGIDITQFTVTDSTALEGVDADQLPADGTVYSVINLGNGIENIYEAVPGSGEGSATITDTLVTPFGNIDLSSLFGGFDATADLDPGAVFTGLDLGDGGLADMGGGLF